MKMRYVILNLFCSIFVSFIYGTTANVGVGPYKSTLISTEPCKNPPKPYDKNPEMIFYGEVYGKKNLLRGNVTVVKVNPNIRISTRGFILEEGQWKSMYIVNSAGCNGALLRLFKIGLNVQNHEGCMPKGTYTFKGDFNTVQHMWAKSYQYGKYQWKVSVGTSTATTLCWDFEVVTEPVISK